jgi:restriction endonuclease S subunit
MKGARMPRISEETFKSLKIPLPSLNIQNNIANNINILKDDIQKLKKQAINNKNLALKEFEKEIFNET